jgi:DNA-binding MarR family transcriptional regulator
MLRRHNLGLVLREVLEAPIRPSRADVAARTGLTRGTMSALVDRLIAAGRLTVCWGSDAKATG